LKNNPSFYYFLSFFQCQDYEIPSLKTNSCSSEVKIYGLRTIFFNFLLLLSVCSVFIDWLKLRVREAYHFRSLCSA